MHHTRFVNEIKDPTIEIIKWLHNNIDNIIGKPITVGMNNNNTIREIEIGKKLTIGEKKKITDKFPELQGKEIG